VNGHLDISAKGALDVCECGDYRFNHPSEGHCSFNDGACGHGYGGDGHFGTGQCLAFRLQEQETGDTCENCQYGDHFNARTDEIDRYGPDVMGCKRPNYEGYTKHESTCEAFCKIIETEF